MKVRAAEAADVGNLAKIWHGGWHDAHAAIVPAALTRLRTLESFTSRLGAALATVRVVGPTGAPVGLCMIKGDELFQLYVSAQARGSGVAGALIADAEVQIAAGGAATAWLACAIGNERAAHFYQKSGWYRARTMTDQLETSGGTFPLEVWRYEKSLVRLA
jgi:ribosomal protein S18 acetylase RimI-like enzyme